MQRDPFDEEPQERKPAPPGPASLSGELSLLSSPLREPLGAAA